ncbi:MAG: crotonase/enoyl-CoA hydratase family protein [Desulfobacteria bacterium]
MTPNVLQFPPVFGSLGQLRVRFDDSRKVLWTIMNPRGRACFNEDLLGDLRKCYWNVEEYNRKHFQEKGNCPILYTVLCSNHPTVYSYGGDIHLFKNLILKKDGKGLRDYAQLCLDTVYRLSVNCNLPMTTISLVQGEALGGGFEGALCCSYIVAERRSRFGLPEILFNLFPGMGAYHFLARRLVLKKVEELMTSGTIYSAEDLYELGVVDVLAEDGGGEKAVYDFVRDHSRRIKARHGIDAVRQDYSRVTKADLERTADIWVDTALKLDPSDIKIMERLVRAQTTKSSEPHQEMSADEAGV